MGRNPFVVTGCGRSGTMYTARVLTAAGLPCSHEFVFSPDGGDPGALESGKGEASWLAVPSLDQGWPEGVVFHQVRHPEDVIRSFLGLGFFDPGPSRVRYWREQSRRWATVPIRFRLGPRPTRDYIWFVKRHEPGVFASEDPAVRAAEYWLRWNQRAGASANGAAGYLRYRVEDMAPTLVHRMAELVGVQIDTRRVDEAFSSVPTDLHTFRVDNPTWSLDRLPPELRQAVRKLAESYGYTFRPPEIGGDRVIPDKEVR
jgi:hypothetical protein